MGELHSLIIHHGREKARELVPARQRRLVYVAAEVLADEAQSLGITYSGFCLTGFPHKKLDDTEVWEKRGLDLPPGSGGMGSERHAATSMVISSMLALAGGRRGPLERGAVVSKK